MSEEPSRNSKPKFFLSSDNEDCPDPVTPQTHSKINTISKELKDNEPSTNLGSLPRGLLRPDSPNRTNSSSTASLADALRQSELTKEDAQIYSRGASREELTDLFPETDDGTIWNANRVAIDPFHIPKILRKNDSYQALQRRGWNANEARVLVLYTGGTIGMVKNDDGGEYNTE